MYEQKRVRAHKLNVDHQEPFPPNSTKRPLPHSKTAKLDEELVKLIVKEYHPFSLVEGVREIINVQAKVKAIVRFFKQSAHGLAKLQSMQQQMGAPMLKLKQDVPTRWNSTYEMFSRLITLKEAIQSTLAILDSGVESLSQSEWHIVEKSCDILKPFLEVTTEMSSEKAVTASKVILLSNALMAHVGNAAKDESLPETCAKMVQVLDEQMKKRFSDVEAVKILAEATFLDPRFKRHGFRKEVTFRNAYRWLTQQANSVEVAECDQSRFQLSAQEANQDSPSIWQTFDTTVSSLVNPANPTAAGIRELDKYLQEPMIPRKTNPILWWKERRHVYPRLFEIMKSRGGNVSQPSAITQAVIDIIGEDSWG
ncbi:zinc finger BED domain-containing protein 4-like [Ornithodoros turicata]|uniref:zinc finger BED domain-containing protein 4-like n=1 Tax=Ornithodoros turicata TaxID=34597 RepID=UPI0031393828